MRLCLCVGLAGTPLAAQHPSSLEPHHLPADARPGSQSGISALAIACAMDCEPLVHALLGAGAKPDIADQVRARLFASSPRQLRCHARRAIASAAARAPVGAQRQSLPPSRRRRRAHPRSAFSRASAIAVWDDATRGRQLASKPARCDCPDRRRGRRERKDQGEMLRGTEPALERRRWYTGTAATLMPTRRHSSAERTCDAGIGPCLNRLMLPRQPLPCRWSSDGFVSPDGGHRLVPRGSTRRESRRRQRLRNPQRSHSFPPTLPQRGGLTPVLVAASGDELVCDMMRDAATSAAIPLVSCVTRQGNSWDVCASASPSG